MVKAMNYGGKQKVLYYETTRGQVAEPNAYGEALEEPRTIHLVADGHFLKYLAVRQVTPQVCITFTSAALRDMYAEKNWRVITETRARLDELEGNVESSDLQKPTEELLIHVVYHHG